MKMPFRAVLIVIVLFTLGSSTSYSQRDIEPTLVFSDTVSFRFSGEWQYLSTDIYLLNGERFSTLINELDFVRNENNQANWRGRRKGLAEEYLEYLFITARLKNVRFFGDNDVTYPLYNFQISRDKDAKYRTFVSDNIENIRIIDNLPLYSASDFIDAEINVRAITNNDRDQMLSLVASQLQSLSRLQTPTNALLGIIGEFGNFIEANTKKKEYRFSSTIRLFEQKNFDTRLHSIRIYALLTANSEPVLINTQPIKTLLTNEDNPQINRQLITDLVNYSTYPLIVVVNYKSLYRMEQVTGDEVNFANIEKRKLKIENDFRAGLINAETYRQEKDFIGFITVFANLKNHLEVYSLNFKTGNSDAISGSLFKLLQYYRQLLKTHDEILFKYRGNSTFSNVFRKEYESIIGYAALYLNEDHNLKRLYSLVQTLVGLEKNPMVEKPDDLEHAIASLRFSDIFRTIHTEQTLEGQLIKLHVEKLEQQLFKVSFEKEVEKLSQTPANNLTRMAPDVLRGLARNTTCVYCKTQAYNAVEDFMGRLTDFYLKEALEIRDSIVASLQPWMFGQLHRLQQARENIGILFPNNHELETRNFLTTKLAESERDIKNLQDFSRIDLTGRELAMVETLNNRLISTQKQAEDALNLVCGLKPELCQKIEVKQPEASTPTQKEVVNAFSSNDSLVRQANIFIAIFEFQLASLSKRVEGDTTFKTRLVDAYESLDKLKIATELYIKSLSNNKRLKKLEPEINFLVIEVSEKISKLESYSP